MAIPDGMPAPIVTAVPCHLVYPHQYTTPAPQCVMRIHDRVYDLTSWRHKHPGGAWIMDQLHNQDATDYFEAFHSKDAAAVLKLLPSTPCQDAQIPRDLVSRRFEELRSKLEREGWFRRDWMVEMYRYVVPTLLLVGLGVALAWRYPVLATVLLGVGLQQAGWLGHDFTHGRDTIGTPLWMLISTLIAGFSPKWWSNKHNTHHAFPNRIGEDSDIHNEPVLHLWFPTPDKDVWYRRYQHLYYPFAYSMLYISWRLQSVHFALTRKDWADRVLIVLSNAWLAFLPWRVAVGALLIGGFLVAIVVTANHQVEELLDATTKRNFVVDQFLTTRGVVCPDPLTEFLFGGMQYQLEHHLFPIMPRHRYPALRSIVTQFAKENGMEHKLSGIADILHRNYVVMREMSQAQAPAGTKVVLA